MRPVSWIERLSSCLNCIYVVETLEKREKFGSVTANKLKQILSEEMDQLLLERERDLKKKPLEEISV